MLVRGLPMGVGVVRRDRSVAFANDAFARILHLPVGPLEATMAPLTRDDGRAYGGGDEPVDGALVEGRGSARRAVGIARPDGGVDQAFLTTLPVSDASGDRTGLIVYLEVRPDLAEERALREAFLETLSHELRTPMTAIYGGTQLLRNDELAPEDRDSVLTDIADESIHLHLLVEDLIALARVERDVLTASREPVLVVRIAENVAAAARRRWPDRLVVIEASLDIPTASADESHVTQILRDLVANAIATSPDGSRIDIRIDTTDADVCVHVGDRGPGLPTGLGDGAFHLYHPSPAKAASRPRSGLPLFIVAALVRAQGGRIWQQDREGGGTEVAFSLPIYESVDPV